MVKRAKQPADLLTAAQVAELRGVSKRAVLASLADGTLRGERVGVVWIVRRKDALAWVPRSVGRQWGTRAGQRGSVGARAAHALR